MVTNDRTTSDITKRIFREVARLTWNGELESKKELLPEVLEAPIKSGDMLGRLIVSANGSTLCELPLVSADDVARMGLFQVFGTLFRLYVGQK